MTIIITICVIIFILSLIAITNASNNAKQGKLIPLKFRHINGIPNLPEGTIVTISSDDELINIDDKYFILQKNVQYKNITDSKMLTEKQKSVIQRSLVGIVVAGPLGAIIGGISGVGTKQTTELVHFLNIGYRDKVGIDRIAMFSLEQTSHLMYLKMFVKSF